MLAVGFDMIKPIWKNASLDVFQNGCRIQSGNVWQIMLYTVHQSCIPVPIDNRVSIFAFPNQLITVWHLSNL